MNKNYMKLDRIDTQHNYTDIKSIKIQRIQNKIKNIQNSDPFSQNDLNEPTDIKMAKLKINLIGLWHLMEINGKDKQIEKIFYNINRSEIKVLPYGEYKNYKNYDYILKNNHVYFGNGPFEINIDKDVMTLNALDYECRITFKKVDVEEIKSTLSAKNHLSSMTSHDLRFYDDYSIKDIMPRFKWKTYAYMYGNDSISYDQKTIEYSFHSDMTFCMTNESGSQYGKFDVKKRALILSYDDGFEQRHKTVFVEYNRKFEHYYLYISEQCDRYEGCYSVYVSC